jgi:alpha/beta superfamily hydrolase
MVRPAEERVSIEGPAGVLEGMYHAAEGSTAGVVICHPHPQYGGSMTSNVVLAAVRGVAARGIATLRFNFRGVGASGGSYDGGRGERDDTAAAVAWFAAQDGVGAVGLAGYSFGATAAAGAASDGVRALTLIAPPIAGETPPLPGLDDYAGPVLLLAGDADPYCPEGELRALGERLGPRADLQVLHRVDHFWGGDEPEIVERVGAFFAKHLGGDA